MVFADFVLIFYRECRQAMCRFRIDSRCRCVWFGLFYLQYPKTFCGFCMHSGILNVWRTYTSMLLANNAKWIQIDFGKHVLDKKTKKTMERNRGKGFYSSSWGSVEPTSSVRSGVRAACERQHHSVKFQWESFELMGRAAGTRQDAGAWWFSPTLFCFSIVNFPKLFAYSA